jgi:acetyl esterase
MPVHPQVALLLEAVAQSPLPTLDKVPAFVARRLYGERCAKVAPKAPEAQTRLLLTPGGVIIRAYRPAGVGKNDVLPELVYFHGGGWTIGDLDTHDVLCRQLANGARCEVFSVEYRLAPESPFPAAVEDCIAATEFVAKNSKSGRVAVGGDSAGGNLAAVVALHARGALCFQLLIYPATDQNMRTESLRRNGEGYLLTFPLMERFRGRPTTPTGAPRPRSRRATPGSRRRSSSPPGSIRCSTRDASTPGFSRAPGSRSRTASIPTWSTASS